MQSHRAWLFRDAARREIAQRWVAFFKEFDVLLLPVTPTAAPGHHNKDHDLNRPGMSGDVKLANQLEELVDRVDRDPSVHAVVFTGAREGRFVSHANVRWLQAEGAAAPDLGRRGASAALRLARGIDRARVPQPIVQRTPMRALAQLDQLHATFLKMNASGVIFVAALNGSALVWARNSPGPMICASWPTGTSSSVSPRSCSGSCPAVAAASACLA
jgi:hypothetical protein